MSDERITASAGMCAPIVGGFSFPQTDDAPALAGVFVRREPVACDLSELIRPYGAIRSRRRRAWLRTRSYVQSVPHRARMAVRGWRGELVERDDSW